MLMRLRGPLTDGRKGGGADEAATCDVGITDSITTDKGAEFAAKAVELWAYQTGVKLDLIRPGKPVQNGYIEKLQRRFKEMNA